jgi:Rod binding domain-containing protein
VPDLAITEAGRLNATDPRLKLKQAAKAFEQQFVAQLLKPMSERSESTDDLFGHDPGSEPFQGLFVDGLAEHASGGLGIATIIEQAMAARLQPKVATPRPGR